MAEINTQNMADLKHQIKVQLAELSRLLGQMPNEDAIVNDARTSFLKLATLISRALDIQVQ
jgi:outer membrane protein TolC